MLNLQMVDLSDCGRLMDAGLHLMAKHSPHLKHLYLRRCINITGKIYDPDPAETKYVGNASMRGSRILECQHWPNISFILTLGTCLSNIVSK